MANFSDSLLTIAITYHQYFFKKPLPPNSLSTIESFIVKTGRIAHMFD